MDLPDDLDIPVEEVLDENDEGTITFKIHETNLALSSSNGCLIVNEDSESGNRGIRLSKDENNTLVYEFFDTSQGLRRCNVDLAGFESYNQFFIGLTWSNSNIELYIRPLVDDQGELRSGSSSDVLAQVHRDRNGRLAIIGGPGVEVGHYVFKEGQQETLRPPAKQIFDFTENKCDILMGVAERTDQFLIESTIVQQIIVMMITGIETYLEERYIELCSKMGIPEDEVSNAMAADLKETPANLRQEANSAGKQVRDLVRDKFNFQDIQQAHKLYERTTGFNLQDVLNKSGNRGDLERNIQFRHAIIHEAVDVSILNIDRFPKQDPIFSNAQYGQETVRVLSDTIQSVHDETESLLEQ